MTDQVFPAEQSLGYYFHPRRYPHAPGHPRLDVVLRAVPSGEHFDPDCLRLVIVSGESAPRFLSVHHPWRGAERLRVCPGFVNLRDRKDKTVEAFTFGGDLRITSREDRTTCVLTSPAPIIEFAPDPRLPDPTIPPMLVEEVEVLIGQRRAAWERHHPSANFDRRLVAADPLLLYCACLEALLERIASFPLKAGNGPHQDFAHYLRAEIRTLRQRGDWPPEVPPLSELL